MDGQRARSRPAPAALALPRGRRPRLPRGKMAAGARPPGARARGRGDGPRGAGRMGHEGRGQDLKGGAGAPCCAGAGRGRGVGPRGAWPRVRGAGPGAPGRGNALRVRGPGRTKPPLPGTSARRGSRAVARLGLGPVLSSGCSACGLGGHQDLPAPGHSLAHRTGSTSQNDKAGEGRTVMEMGVWEDTGERRWPE